MILRRSKDSSGHARGSRHRSRGQTLVEFAFVFPIFMLLLMTLLDFGRVVFAQNAITQDAREASRVGAVNATLTQAKYDAMRAAGLTMSPGVPISQTNIFGDSTACSTVPDNTVAGTCFYPDGVAIGQRVIVNVSITIDLITPVVSTILGKTFTLSALSISYVQ